MLVLACAPEPTTPASTNLGGIWKSDAHVFGLTQFKLTLIQESGGIVSGEWYVRTDGGVGDCPPRTACEAFGNLIGWNTVSQVELELLGAGKFEGALVEPNRLRGIFIVSAGSDTITFVK